MTARQPATAAVKVDFRSLLNWKKQTSFNVSNCKWIKQLTWCFDVLCDFWQVELFYLQMSQRSSQLEQRGRGTRRAAVWCLAIALVVQSARAGSPWRRGSGPLLTHHLSKRSFFDIQCKGVYDKTIFAKLDRICEDCYNLFREPQVHSLCMWVVRVNCTQSEISNLIGRQLLIPE